MPGENALDQLLSNWSFRSPEFKDTFRGVAAWETRQSSTRMTAGATQEELFDGRVVLCSAMQGPHHEGLVNG